MKPIRTQDNENAQKYPQKRMGDAMHIGLNVFMLFVISSYSSSKEFGKNHRTFGDLVLVLYLCLLMTSQTISA